MVGWVWMGLLLAALGGCGWPCLCRALGGCVVWGCFAFGDAWWSGLAVLGWSGWSCFRRCAVIRGGCAWVGCFVVVWARVNLFDGDHQTMDGLASQTCVPAMRHRIMDGLV